MSSKLEHNFVQSLFRCQLSLTFNRLNHDLSCVLSLCTLAAAQSSTRHRDVVLCYCEVLGLGVTALRCEGGTNGDVAGGVLAVRRSIEGNTSTFFLLEYSVLELSFGCMGDVIASVLRLLKLSMRPMDGLDGKGRAGVVAGLLGSESVGSQNAFIGALGGPSSDTLIDLADGDGDGRR